MKPIALLLISISIVACNFSKKSNTDSAPIPTASNQMVLFKGAEFMMGSDIGLPNQKPAHKVKVTDFKLDIYPVTVAEFAKFVTASSYVTDAERFGDAGVYNFDIQQWELKKGANWQYPMGPDQPKAELNHPVTQVSWNDAQAYCQWAKKRLPTEAEWEFAARNGGTTASVYSWGDKLKIKDKYCANVWLGLNMNADQNDDGFKFTSPVGHFGFTPSGLTDMGGNVWNWCQDEYNLYPGNNENSTAEPNSKCMRGGSFFFDPALENSYTVFFRGSNTPETSLFNIGFRCAANP